MTSSHASDPTSTVAGLLLARADDDRPGLRFDDREWSWREVVSASAARASWMSSVAGPRPIHLGVLLGNLPEYLFWLGAAALRGDVVVGINPTRRGDALAGDIIRTDCSVLITDEEGAALLEGLEFGVPAERVIRIDDVGYQATLQPHEPAGGGLPTFGEPPAPEDLYLLLFTSGTTGDPKAVRCTQGRLASIAKRAAEAYGFNKDDVAYCTMPLFHGNALMALWGPALVVGATVALARRFSASGFVGDVRRYRATTFTYVGKALAYVLATPPSPDDASITLRRGFGTEASVVDHLAFERRFGCQLTEGYGSSEGGATVMRTPDTPIGALGRATSDVAVVDPETRAECPPARFDAEGRMCNGSECIGEIVNRSGVGGFEGYYADEEASASRTRDGWYWTGDLAYRDEEGFFYFAGRGGDWMRVDSENLTAGPVERLLLRYDGAAAVAVYAVPDPRSGDQVMAAFEMLPDRSLDPEGFAGFLASQPDLGTKWSPSFVRVTNGLPQTASGKVTKGPLRAEGWWAGADPVYRRTIDGAYLPMDEEDRRALRDEHRRHGREGLVGG